MDSAVLNIESFLLLLLVGVLLLLVVVLLLLLLLLVLLLLLLLVVVVVVVVVDDDFQCRTVSFQPVVVWYVSIWCPGINGQILEIMCG